MKTVQKKYLKEYLEVFFPYLLSICITILLIIIKIYDSITQLTYSIFVIDIVYLEPCLFYIFIFIFSCISSYVISTRKNNGKECFSQSKYKNYPINLYWMKRHISGFTKLNMKLVPIYKQFELIKKNWFELIWEGFLYPDDNDIEYEVLMYPRINNVISNSINLIISDTYIISKSQLPITLQDNKSIWIKRKNDSDYRKRRIFSSKLISLVEEQVLQIKEYKVPINLFLTCNPKTIEVIVKKIFMTGGRDNFTLNIYQQSDKNGREFIDKPHKVKF